MTSSVFVHDIRSPVPVSEFLLPMRDELRFPQYQNFLERKDFRVKEYWPPTPNPGNLSLMAGARSLLQATSRVRVKVRANVEIILKFRARFRVEVKFGGLVLC